VKILVVEDDFVSRKLLFRLLEQYGEVDIALNGREALDVVQHAWDSNCPYQLICLDIMMPEMDGREFLRTLRKEEELRGFHTDGSTKVIMTSALNDKKSVFSSFKEGCEGYLVKPVRKQELITILKKFELTK